MLSLLVLIVFSDGYSFLHWKDSRAQESALFRTSKVVQSLTCGCLAMECRAVRGTLQLATDRSGLDERSHEAPGLR